MLCRKLVALVLMALVLSVGWLLPAQAGTATTAYSEPTQTTAGTAITNLSKTSIYWKQDSGAEQRIDVPASSPSGGGTITKTYVYTTPGACSSTTVTEQATATTTVESARTAAVTATRNGTPPPGDPSCVTATIPGSLTLQLGP